MSLEMPIDDRWVRIDRDWNVVEVGDGVIQAMREAVGHNLWDCFPGSEEVFRSTYEQGWEQGAISKLHHYRGNVVQTIAFVRDGHLLVSYEYVTIDGIEEVLERLTSPSRSAF